MNEANVETTRVIGFLDALRERLRRFKPSDLVLPALSLVAAYMLVSLIGQLDFAEVWDSLKDASWYLIAIAAAVGQGVYVTEAIGMRFATGRPLPLIPLTVLQVAVRWIGLAVPTVAGRVGMNAAFLTRLDVPATTAVVQGALDGGAGFVVEAALLVFGLVVTDFAPAPDVEIRWEVVLLIVVVAGFGGAVAVWRIRRLREWVVPVIRDACELVSGLVRDPKRATGLVLANLGTRVTLGVTLWFILVSVGTPLSLVGALLATVATNLLAGLVPVPGGIGVAEATMTSMLVLAGIDPEAAFAAVVVYRVSTFYVPALAGWPATRWLKNHRYI